MNPGFQVRIFQPIVPEYRVALFEGVGKRYGGRAEIWAAERFGRHDRSYPLESIRYDYAHPFRKLAGSLLWQKGLSLRGLHRGDVVVVCGDLHQVSSLWIAFLAKCRGIRVVWWGHHLSAMARPSRVAFRLAVARRLSDVMLCYTDTGIRYLLEHGFPPGRVFATGNTIDIDAVESATRAWDGKRRFGDTKTLLFCGVLRPKVHLDILLKALAALMARRTDFRCVIVGDGPKRQEWEEMAGRLGLAPRMEWAGEIRGQENLASWFLSSDLFVYPGQVGLSVIHALSFGLPVVLNDDRSDHNPEYEAFEPGSNGWAFRKNDPEDLARVLDAALDSGRLREFGENGRKVAFSRYSIRRMAERFSEAVEAAAALS